MALVSLNIATATRWPSRAPLLAALLAPAWTIAATLPGFFDVGRDLPLTTGAPTWWAIVDTLPGIDRLPLAGLAMALAIGVGATLLAWFAALPPRRDSDWAAGLLAALILPFLLSAMAVTDFVPAVLFAIADAWRRQDDREARWVIAGILTAAIGLSVLGGCIVACAIWRIGQVAIVLPANDNALPLGPQRLYPPAPRA